MKSYTTTMNEKLLENYISVLENPKFFLFNFYLSISVLYLYTYNKREQNRAPTHKGSEDIELFHF